MFKLFKIYCISCGDNETIVIPHNKKFELLEQNFDKNEPVFLICQKLQRLCWCRVSLRKILLYYRKQNNVNSYSWVRFFSEKCTCVRFMCNVRTIFKSLTIIPSVFQWHSNVIR